MNYCRTIPIKNLTKIPYKSISTVKSTIILPKIFDVGFGRGQLRPDGSRSRAEFRVLANLTMAINGMSGQQV